MKDLLRIIPQVGSVDWMGIRPERRAPLEIVDSIEIDEATGIVGDHFSGKPGAKRQVTLIQAEHIEVMCKILQRDSIDPCLLRRNLVVSGINLKSLKGHAFRIGSAVLYGTGNCAPCSRMEMNLGEGGYNSMRGHGGITARVIDGGSVKVGDAVALHEDVFEENAS